MTLKQEYTFIVSVADEREVAVLRTIVLSCESGTDAQSKLCERLPYRDGYHSVLKHKAMNMHEGFDFVVFAGKVTHLECCYVETTETELARVTKENQETCANLKACKKDLQVMRSLCQLLFCIAFALALCFFLK